MVKRCNIGGTGFTQQPTVRLSNISGGQGGRGARPSVRENLFTQYGGKGLRNESISRNKSTEKHKDFVVRCQGSKFIMLRTWSQYHHYNYSINSNEEMAFPDQEGQEVDAEQYEIADEAEEGEQYLHHKEEERDTIGLFDKLLLDSGATHTTTCNPDVVEQIHKASMTLYMLSNMGLRLIKEACVLGVYFDLDGKANVMSMSKMIFLGYCITMDSNVATSEKLKK